MQEQDWNTVTIQKKKTIGNSAQSIAQAKQAGSIYNDNNDVK